MLPSVVKVTGFSWLAFWIFIVGGAIWGTGIGYSASSVQDTQIAYNGTHINVGNESADITIGKIQTTSTTNAHGIIGFQSAYVGTRALSTGAAQQMLTIAATTSTFVADAYATFIYHYRDVIPVWFVELYIFGTGIGVPLGVVYYRHRGVGRYGSAG